MVVIRAAEQNLYFQLIQGLLQRMAALFNFRLQIVVLFLTGQLPKGLQILLLAGQRLIVADIRLKLGQLLQQTLGGFLIIPKVGGRRCFFQPCGLLFLSCHIQSFL